MLSFLLLPPLFLCLSWQTTSYQATHAIIVYDIRITGGHKVQIAAPIDTFCTLYSNMCEIVPLTLCEGQGLMDTRLCDAVQATY